MFLKAVGFLNPFLELPQMNEGCFEYRCSADNYKQVTLGKPQKTGKMGHFPVREGLWQSPFYVKFSTLKNKKLCR